MSPIDWLIVASLGVVGFLIVYLPMHASGGGKTTELPDEDRPRGGRRSRPPQRDAHGASIYADSDH